MKNLSKIPVYLLDFLRLRKLLNEKLHIFLFHYLCFAVKVYISK